MPDLVLLHFEPRYQHAGHYLLYAKGIGRGREYARDVIRGSKLPPHALVRDAILNFVDITIARTWVGSSRTERLRLRRNGSLSRFCPICRDQGIHHP